jgi:hypothetical protein
MGTKIVNNRSKIRDDVMLQYNIIFGHNLCSWPKAGNQKLHLQNEKINEVDVGVMMRTGLSTYDFAP